MQYQEESGTFFGYNKGSPLHNDPIIDWREQIAHRCLPLSKRQVDSWPHKPSGYRYVHALP